ncbi:MAG: metallophosphoesterase [Candidatus Hydrothermarchaeales archaeon]
MTDITPIYNEKALKIGDALVIADLHIGIEHQLSKKGVKVPSQIQKMEDRIQTLSETAKAERLIILGDLKHNIPKSSLQEYRGIPRFINSLKKHLDIVIVKGNHDGRIEQLLPGIDISKHLEVDNALLTHGHSWPKSVDFDHIIMGHNHPCIEFVDDFGRRSREPAWIKTRFNHKINDFYDLKRTPEIIIMPAFNDLITGSPFNREGKQKLIGPFFNKGVVDLEGANAYLLDGTFLGRIKDLRPEV